MVAGIFTDAILEKGRALVKRSLLMGCVVAALGILSSCAGSGPANSPDGAMIESDDPPTPVLFEGQPTPVLLPRTNLYIFLTSSRPLYYRNGHYYQFWRDQWYSGEDLKGPWQKAGILDIPDLLRSVPPEYYYDNFPYKLRKER